MPWYPGNRHLKLYFAKYLETVNQHVGGACCHNGITGLFQVYKNQTRLSVYWTAKQFSEKVPIFHEWNPLPIFACCQHLSVNSAFEISVAGSFHVRSPICYIYFLLLKHRFLFICLFADSLSICIFLKPLLNIRYFWNKGVMGPTEALCKKIAKVLCVVLSWCDLSTWWLIHKTNVLLLPGIHLSSSVCFHCRSWITFPQ